MDLILPVGQARAKEAATQVCHKACFANTTHHSTTHSVKQVITQPAWTGGPSSCLLHFTPETASLANEREPTSSLLPHPKEHCAISGITFSSKAAGNHKLPESSWRHPQPSTQSHPCRQLRGMIVAPAGATTEAELGGWHWRPFLGSAHQLRKRHGPCFYIPCTWMHIYIYGICMFQVPNVHR